jgi:hypothetical protein
MTTTRKKQSPRCVNCGVPPTTWRVFNNKRTWFCAVHLKAAEDAALAMAAPPLTRRKKYRPRDTELMCGTPTRRGTCRMYRPCAWHNTEVESPIRVPFTHRAVEEPAAPACPSSNTAVDHPPHYNAGKIEVIAAIEDWGLGFNLGNVVKYCARAQHKGNELEDLQKAAWYIARELMRRQG